MKSDPTPLPFRREEDQIIRWIAVAILVLDQWTKWLVVRHLPFGSEWELLPGFFNLVHWGNTGSAWSMFRDNNLPLAAISGSAAGFFHNSS